MKKLLFFLILIISIAAIKPINTNAKTYKFYEAEYIDGIWINKYNPSTKETFYQKARFFRQVDTNEFAYCIETFNTFNENGNYNSTNTPPTLSNTQKERISQIAHFGYGYKNHTDVKWYAITQFMIWQTANPEGDYYFTDSLNGNRITKFTNEIDEINNLITNYNTLPTVANKTYDHIEDQDLTRTDLNEVLKNYKSNNTDVLEIKNNQMYIKKLKEGKYTVTIERISNVYNKPIVFFQSNTSQDLVETGNIDKKTAKIYINIKSNSITFKKVDSESKDFTSQGDAKLDGAIYELFDRNYRKKLEFEIINNKFELKNISFGTYYIREKTPGIGYKLNPKEYTVILTSPNPHQEIILENEVIKANLIIKKQYKFQNKLQPEKNIKFNIYNSKKELVTTIKTDNEGIAKILLPYGKYTLEQINTTEGYTKIKNQEFSIENENDIILELENYKIEVPNTNTLSIIDKIISFLKKIIC